MTAPLVTFRTRLYTDDPTHGIKADADRNFVYLYTASADLGQYQQPVYYTLIPPTGPPVRVPRCPWPKEAPPNAIAQKIGMPFCHFEDSWDSFYHGGLVLPDGIRPGTYQLDPGRGNGPEAVLTVLPAVRRTPAITILPAFSSATVQSYLNNPNVNNLVFVPGEYQYPAPLQVRGGTQLRGPGAVFNPPLTGFGDFWPVFQVNGDDVSAYGLTFAGNRLAAPGGMGFHAPVTRSGLVLGRCVFDDIDLGVGFRESFIRNCRSPSGTANIAPGGLWLRNRWEGPWAGGHAFAFGPGCGPLAMVDNLWDGTDRGVTLNTYSGPLADILLVGSTFQNVVQSPGGGELILAEGNKGLSRLIALHTRAVGCNGSVLQLGNDDTVADQVIVRDMKQYGGQGAILWGHVTNSSIDGFEGRDGAGIYLGSNTKAIAVLNSDASNWSPSWGPADFPETSALGMGRKAAIVDLGVGNTAANVTATVADPVAHTPIQGFAVQAVP